jgi:very-short-patch-repair endonuclease
MKQVVKRNISKQYKVKPKSTKKYIKKPIMIGTSKLEEDFAKEFLDKLGVKYIYQFEARSIGRYYDFYLPNHNLIIEVDGDYWHSNPKFYNNDSLTPTQKKNKRVDEAKNRWALMNGIPILRIWENDIRKNPTSVMQMLKETLNIQDKKRIINENKKKRH